VHSCYLAEQQASGKQACKYSACCKYGSRCKLQKMATLAAWAAAKVNASQDSRMKAADTTRGVPTMCM